MISKRTILTPICLQKGFKVSNEDKFSAIKNKTSNDSVDIFPDHEILYKKYFINYLNDLTKDPSQYLPYNEFLLTELNQNKYLKLVFDIDLILDNVLKDEDGNKISMNNYILNFKKKNNITSNENDINILISSLIKDFIEYIFKKTNLFNIEFKPYNEDSEKIDKLTISHLSTEAHITQNTSIYKYLEQQIYKHIYITQNTNKSKLSYHIYFNNILYKGKDIPLIKKIIKHFKESCNNNILIQNLDENIYRKNPTLRFIYSSKTAEDIYYHIPLKTKIEINKKNNHLKFKVLQETKIITNKNIANYLFSYITTMENMFRITSFDERDLEIASLTSLLSLDSIDTNNIKNLDNLEEIPDFLYLTPKLILNIIFNTIKKIDIEFTQCINNYEYFQNQTNFLEIGSIDNIEFSINYQKTNCLFCNKSEHKKTHKIILQKEGLIILKNGRAANCKKVIKPYNKLTEWQICNYIYIKNLVKRTICENLIVYTKTKGWVLLKTDFSFIKNVILENSSNFKLSDMKTIENMKECSLKETFKCLTKNSLPCSINHPYLFKFKNGIYDFVNKKFINIQDSIEYTVINGVDYDYIDEENYSQSQKEQMNFLNNIIDEIIPTEKPDGSENIYREIFEKNISTVLLMIPKDIITVFFGNTSAGKSTMANLIISAVGFNNHIRIPILTYVNPIEPNKPNPWLGNIGNKLLSIASESAFNERMNSQAIKLMTDPIINARELNSNERIQFNYLTQIIDTNFPIKLDKEDPAVYRRLAIIPFKTFFKRDDISHLGYSENTKENLITLRTDILNNKFQLIFFNILKQWMYKYDHITQLNMISTANLTPVCLITEAIKNLTVFGKFVKLDQIKQLEELKSVYKRTKRVHNKDHTVTYTYINLRYFKEKIENLIKYYDWKDLDVDNILQPLIFRDINMRQTIPAVLISDIKESELENVIKVMADHNEKINFEYYHKHKHVFNKIEKDDVTEINIFN